MTTPTALAPPTHSDDHYIDAALKHKAFQQMQASAAIEDIHFTNDQIVVAGRYILGEIDEAQWDAIITTKHGLQPELA
jgi:hypothetical protein